MLIKRLLDTETKLQLLSQASQFDLACACGSGTGRRTRLNDQKWLYPVTMPNGSVRTLFRILLSSVCRNTCGYCPLRLDADLMLRCSLDVEELVSTFLDYYRRRLVFGIFLTSGVAGFPDQTMERLCAVARVLRKRELFKGYIHLKLIPGASQSAIAEAVSLADAVSLNIESPGVESFNRLRTGKEYLSQIIAPMKFASRLVKEAGRYRYTSFSTQFVVGAAGETDRDLVRYTSGLYSRLGLSRVYFSAYQKGQGAPWLPGESEGHGIGILTREHRLYQMDFLLRRYGFTEDEIPLDAQGFLDTEIDPKEHWARLHPENFPVKINSAGRLELLRIPGIGPVTVDRILELRRGGTRLRSLADLKLRGLAARKAGEYVVYS